MVEGAPFGRPAFFCGVWSLLGCGPLLSWACLVCRGAAVIVGASVQECQVSARPLYYTK